MDEREAVHGEVALALLLMAETVRYGTAEGIERYGQKMFRELERKGLPHAGHTNAEQGYRGTR